VAVTGGAVDNLYTIDQMAGFSGIGQMTWVPYTTLGQTFLPQNLTRDGDWTMVANTTTAARPAPQPSGPEEDLLPVWTPTRQSASGAYIVYNEWTLSQAGWVDQYGVDVISQNVGDAHNITLRINGVVKDTFSATPNTAGIYWHDITPIVVAVGAVIRVTLQITASGSNSWYQQLGLFASAPVYCSSAVGAKDAGAPGTTAYGCHLLFTPGTASPDWDVVAYGGEAAGGGGGGGIVLPIGAWTIEGNPTGSTTTETAFTIGSLTSKPTPDPSDQILLQDNIASGALKAVPWSAVLSGGGAPPFSGTSKAGLPTNSDVPVGYWMLIRDTLNNTTGLYYNDAGTLEVVYLTHAPVLTYVPTYHIYGF
jgi:hypothetical protein